MDQESYSWMWSKRKEGFNSHVLLSSSPSYGDSWEEQAFAEDAAGPLGGCIWPPRSYTCSFCRREFRSAQALGGHMNVHRRDRARLKQIPSPNNNLEMLQHQPNQILNPSQNICLSMVSNPNSDHLDHAFLASPSSIFSRVSILPTPNINDERTFLFPSSSPFIQENLKSTGSTSFSSWSKLDHEKCFHIQGLDKEKDSKVFESNCIAKKNHVKNDLSMNLNLMIRQGCEMAFDDKDDDDDVVVVKEKGSKVFESNCIAKKNHVKNDLSMNLNLMIRQGCEMAFDDKDDDDDVVVVLGCKRRRIDQTLSFFPKRVSVNRDQPESEVLDEQSPSSTDNLDLELRLGARPK